MPPVQIHVALLGIRCLYHHDVHGWWTTKGLWDVHMLRVRSTRPSQSLLGGTKRRSRLGTMPWPRIILNDTGVVSLSQRTVEEFLQFSEAWFQPKLFAGFIAPWTVLVFQNPQVPTMLIFIDATSQSVRSVGGNRLIVVKAQFCHPKALPRHGRWLFFRCIQRRLQGDLRKIFPRKSPAANDGSVWWFWGVSWNGGTQHHGFSYQKMIILGCLGDTVI